MSDSIHNRSFQRRLKKGEDKVTR